MTQKKFRHPFLENFRHYEVPKQKLAFIHENPDLVINRYNRQAPANPSANHERKNPKPDTGFVKNDSHPHNLRAAESADHFEHAASREHDLPNLANASNGANIETASGLFTATQNLLYSSPKEVKSLMSNLERALTHSYAPKSDAKSSSNPSLAKSSVYQASPSMAHRASAEGLSENSAFANLAQEWSIHNVSENVMKSSLGMIGQESAFLAAASDRSSLASQILVGAVQRLLQSVISRLPSQGASQELLLKQSIASNPEAAHLLEWGMQLGVSPKVLASLLPFLAQVQESTVSSRPLFQGLAFLFTAFTNLFQMNSSNLTWMLLKGMLILETQAQMSQVHSPLLDELGALLSTSRRRLRREAKKRMSPLDKVSRKDSCLADMDAQETAPDHEALIDLWPKKESNNPSMSFYYADH